jgi:hypothetical protein
MDEANHVAEDTQSLFSLASDPQSDDLNETASAASRTISSTSALNPSSPDVKIRIFLKGLESYLISRYNNTYDKYSNSIFFLLLLFSTFF